MAQGRQRVCGFARLGNEQCKTAFLQHRVTVTEFRSNLDVDRHTCEGFKPIFRNHACIKRCTTSNDGDALHARQVEIHLRQGNGLLQWTNVARECLRDHGGLLKNLFLHIMAVIALFDLRR